MKQKIPVGSSDYSLMHSSKTKSSIEKVMHFIFILCGFTAVLSVVVITAYMVISGAPAIAEIGIFKFLLGKIWAPTASDPQFGILPLILSSIFGTFGAILIGVPIGLMTAIFLAEVAPRQLTRLVRPAVELLAGIPSVVYGIIGMIVIVPTVHAVFPVLTQYNGGATLFSAIIVLSIMILPTIVSVCETSLRAVPQEYKEASLAMGASSIQTIFKVMVPAAKSGITTGVVLGIGRAVGEAMAIIMVAGNVVNMPSLFGSVRFLTTGIVAEMAYSSGLHRQALFGVGLVLFFFIMVINIILNSVLKQSGQKK